MVARGPWAAECGRGGGGEQQNPPSGPTLLMSRDTHTQYPCPKKLYKLPVVLICFNNYKLILQIALGMGMGMNVTAQSPSSLRARRCLRPPPAFLHWAAPASRPPRGETSPPARSTRLAGRKREVPGISFYGNNNNNNDDTTTTTNNNNNNNNMYHYY